MSEKEVMSEVEHLAEEMEKALRALPHPIDHKAGIRALAQVIVEHIAKREEQWH
jgi:hypothetical protein